MDLILEYWEIKKNYNKDFFEKVKVHKNEIIEELINIEYQKLKDEATAAENCTSEILRTHHFNAIRKK